MVSNPREDEMESKEEARKVMTEYREAVVRGIGMAEDRLENINRKGKPASWRWQEECLITGHRATLAAIDERLETLGG